MKSINYWFPCLFHDGRSNHFSKRNRVKKNSFKIASKKEKFKRRKKLVGKIQFKPETFPVNHCVKTSAKHNRSKFHFTTILQLALLEYYFMPSKTNLEKETDYRADSKKGML